MLTQTLEEDVAMITKSENHSQIKGFPAVLQ